MKSKSGMTLIDVLGSFMIVAILSVSMTSLLLALVKRGNIDKKRITANQVAELYAENVNKCVNANSFYTKSSSTNEYTVTGLFSGKGQLIPNLSTTQTSTITPEQVMSLAVGIKLTNQNVDTALGNNGEVGSSMVGKNLFNSGYQMKVNGTVYDQSNVEIWIANKNSKYRVVVILVRVTYYNGRMIEVMRDANAI